MLPFSFSALMLMVISASSGFRNWYTAFKTNTASIFIDGGVLVNPLNLENGYLNGYIYVYSPRR